MTDTQTAATHTRTNINTHTAVVFKVFTKDSDRQKLCTESTECYLQKSDTMMYKTYTKESRMHQAM